MRQTQDQNFNELRNYYRNLFYPFTNDQLRDLVSQIDLYIQIIIQSFLITQDFNQQLQLYQLLYEFSRRKDQVNSYLKIPKF